MKTVILSVGGSMIIKEEINIKFLKEFKKIILNFVSRGHRVVLVAGGGGVCRHYQETVQKISKVSDDNLDWLGISATKLNAQLLWSIFADSGRVYEKVIANPTLKLKTDKQIIIGSGWKPGFSSDKDAVFLAINLGAQSVINVSNIDYVYDKDPRHHKNAKKIETMTWEELLTITGHKWKPGMHVPFDPEASKLCQEKNITVKILNGQSLKNLSLALADKKFTGTVIKN